MRKLAFTAAAVLVSAASASAKITPSQVERLTEAAQVVHEIRDSMPQQYWDRARCAAVIPNLKKAALIFGGEYGKGVMSCRAGDRWSAPVFLQLAKGSWGFQAGAEEVDVVLLVMNEEGVQKLLRNKVTLGADASVAAGPVGRQGQVDTDLALTAEIVSYSRAKGLFAGIDLSGGVLRPDTDANTAVYGNGAGARTILATREASAPTEAHAFLAALDTHTAAVPTATAGMLTSDDLRERAIDIQQTLDRILADTTPDPGGRATDTVSVDRARLLQMRRDLD